MMNQLFILTSVLGKAGGLNIVNRLQPNDGAVALDDIQQDKGEGDYHRRKEGEYEYKKFKGDGTGTGGASCGGFSITLNDGTRYGVFDDVEHCKRKCFDDPKCDAFVWREDGHCYWKTGVTEETIDEQYDNQFHKHTCYFKITDTNHKRRRAFDNKYNKLNGGRRRAQSGMPEGMSAAYLCLNEFGSLSAEEACEEMGMLGQTLELSATNTGMCFNVPMNKKDNTWLCLAEVQDSEQACKDMAELGMRLAVSASDRGMCFLLPLKDELLNKLL